MVRNGCCGRGREAEKRENEMGGKIKGSEFIFALIATELRNCLTGKIAPAQANYIHLLSLLAFVGAVLFYLEPISLPFLFLFASSFVKPHTLLFYLFVARHRRCSISSYFRGLSLAGVILNSYYLTWNNRVIYLCNNDLEFYMNYIYVKKILDDSLLRRCRKCIKRLLLLISFGVW